MAPSLVPIPLDLRRLATRLVWGMVWLETLIVVLDAGGHHGGLVGPDLAAWFDAASESGLGSWVSVTQTVLLALTAGVLWAVVRASGAGRARRLGWAGLTAVFGYLALDDGTRLHERVGSAFADSAASASGIGAAFPSYYWQLVLGPVFAAMGLFIAVFLWREFREARLRGLVAGALGLLALAVGLDFIDGLAFDHPANLTARLAVSLDLSSTTLPMLGLSGPDTLAHFSRAVEESLEMAAMTLLWAALLTHLGSIGSGVAIRWAPDPPADEAADRAAHAASASVGSDGAATAPPVLA